MPRCHTVKNRVPYTIGNIAPEDSKRELVKHVPLSAPNTRTSY
uniref:Uncharacterized protein n=1 Tax=Anguilla anguilla TaxID=7936 RepID=A0A0E9SE90_ANGAN